ncbi:MAG: spore germination protein [Chloroflexia bacterium]|nr:spore germination protein [Chloroflexia bacterium]
MIVALVLLAALATLPGAAQAQQPQWSAMGTLPRGSWSVLPEPSDANTLYALSSAGISRTGDKGGTWSVCAPGASMMRLVAPVKGQAGKPLLYSTTATGVRVSDDGCRTWRDVPQQGLTPSAAHVRWLAAYPNNMSVLYAGMDGLGGLFRSTDTGATWQAASKGLPANSWVTALTADPKKPSNIYMGLQFTTRDHPTAYIYKSLDGGLTWRSSSLGLRVLPNNGGEIAGLGWSGNTLFAATSQDGLYKSTDAGVTWSSSVMPRRSQASSSAANGSSLPLKVSGLFADAEGALVLATEEGAYQSLDGGSTWTAFGPEQAGGRPVMLALDPGSGRVVVSSEGNAYGYTMPTGLVRLPQQATSTATHAPPTPPPAVSLATYTPTPTPVPPTVTPTAPPTATPTVALVNGPKPSDPVPPGDPEVSDYFEQTKHNITHGFRDYWHANGGLARFGYPLTEEFGENGISVQYFERARFEFRDGRVVLGNIGTELVKGLTGQPFRALPFFVSTDDNIYFGPTKHSTSGPFLEYWRAHGRIDGMGYPVSESYSPSDGLEIQWFERARFEWHRDFPESRRIVLANIGTELLQKRGWIK